MLEVARLTGEVYESTATGGSTTTLEDSNMDQPAEHFEGGTLWLLSGDNEGVVTRVLEHGEDSLKIATQDNAVADGDQYAVSPNYIHLELLKQACLWALRNLGKLMKSDTSLTVVEDQEEYTLPDGVSDIRRVELATNSTAPYTYERHYAWREMGGTLVFHPDRIPDTDEGNLIRLWYAGYHAEIDTDEDLEIPVALMKWEAAAFIWRNILQRTGNDDKMAGQMLNEANVNAAAARRSMRQPIPRDPHLAVY